MDNTIIKGITDRLYEKRKSAALDLETVVRQSATEGDNDTIKNIIDQLSKDFAYAVHQPNVRNGGLIGLAAVAIALGPNDVAIYLEDIIHPVLTCFGDQDARVRYYACESLYNIAKVGKGEILLYFNEIFDVLCKLSADPDPSVKNGADLLDRLIKDIICEKATTYISVISQTPIQDYQNSTQSTFKDSNGQTFQLQQPQESTAFSLPKFIPLLMERINTIDPFTRVFLISWITVLNSVPDLYLISYLPAFLDGLLNFLGDSHNDVKVLTQTALNTFLHDVRKVSEIQKLIKSQKEKLKFDKKNDIVNENNDNNNNNDNDRANDNDNDNDKAYDNDNDKVNDNYKDNEDDENSKNDNNPIEISKVSTPTEIISNDDKKIKNFEGIDESPREQSSLHNDELETEENDSHDGETYIPGQDIYLDYPAILEILISHIDDTEEKIQSVILIWLGTLLEISPMSFIPYLPKLLSNLLLTMAKDDGSNLKEKSKDVNLNLLKLVENLNESDEKKLNYSAIINSLTLHFLNENEITKVAALDWLKMLHKKSRKSLLEHGDIYTTLLKALSDSSEEVIYGDLQLISEISDDSDEENFTSFIVNLLELFKNDQKLLEKRGNFILRRLCLSLDPARVYQTLAKVLKKETNNVFVGIIIQILNNNLITAPELSNLRKRLRNLENKQDYEFFATLFKAWCHNAPATLALCLLAQSYELAYSVLQIFVDFEITVNILVQIDILVQLLESPVFTRVRLQLLEPEKYPYLYKCLYGILMLLPQSSAFSTLKNRLSSVSVLNTFANNESNKNLSETSKVEEQHFNPENPESLVKKKFKYVELLQRFRSIQQEHEDTLLKNSTSLLHNRVPPKYSDTPTNEVQSSPFDNHELKTPKNNKIEPIKSAVRKVSGRSFVLKGFGGDKL
ncbi:hypothetical protein WICMUC_005009 [Wickerhamomyces mucosus]|uniref:Vacuolar protein 14 C-terminal Fig4-binding domain-containing protein n=1 Tax=Wickerhamomyces mucosus TaxID=1378264 RepID=A0A9P8T8G0_9ASCO|nr:hypothetical protein WICMUC_005009 [Wickerhamomyces mucosus]